MVALSECEGVKNCATWEFAAAKAHAQWSDGVSADLNVVLSDADSWEAPAFTRTGTRGNSQEYFV
jgi:hypothetical protein